MLMYKIIIKVLVCVCVCVYLSVCSVSVYLPMDLFACVDGRSDLWYFRVHVPRLSHKYSETEMNCYI